MNAGVKDVIIIALYTLTSVLVCFIINAYPLNDVDSKRYLSGANTLIEITYGSVLYPLFIRFFSWFDTLWTVIVFQNIFTALALLLLFQTLFEKYRAKTALFSLVIPFTSYVIYTNMIMTDFFITIIVIFLVIFIIAKSAKVLSFSALVLLFSFVGHKGFFYVFLFAILVLFIISFVTSLNIDKRRITFLAIILFSSTFLLSPLLSTFYVSKHSSSREVTVFCRHNYGLRDSKLLKDYFVLACENGRDKYCRYLNAIDNIQENRITRNQSIRSLFKKRPSPICIYVKEREQNCKDIVTWIFSDRGRVFEYVKHQFCRLLILASRADDLIIPANSQSLAVQSDLYGDDINYINNKQITIGNDFLQGYVPIYTFFLYANLLAFLLAFVYILKNKIELSSKIKTTLVVFSLSVICNIVFYGIMSTETNQRYMLRVTWLLPLAIYILLAHLHDRRKRIMQE